MDDSILFNKIQDGDMTAFYQVYMSYWPLLYSHAVRMLRDEEEAKDVVQDLFIYAWENRSKIQFDKIKPFLYVSLRNRVINRSLRSKVEQKYLKRTFPVHNFDEYLHVEEDVVYKELEAEIEKGIEALPPKMQAIFRMSRVENLSHKEIAEQLKVTTDNVKKTINRALKIIRSGMTKIIFTFFLFFMST